MPRNQSGGIHRIIPSGFDNNACMESPYCAYCSSSSASAVTESICMMGETMRNRAAPSRQSSTPPSARKSSAAKIPANDTATAWAKICRKRLPLLTIGNRSVPKKLQPTRNSVIKPINATAFAASICSGFRERGERIRKSWRSGKSISHSKMETAPITTNENSTKKYWSSIDPHRDRPGYWFCRKKATMRPGMATTETARTTVVNVSPSTWMVSLSKKRRKKWSIKARVTRWLLAMTHLHDFYHLARHLLRVRLLHQLRKDALERRQLHQPGQLARRGIGNHLALCQHNHTAAHPLHRLQHMRDVK